MIIYKFHIPPLPLFYSKGSFLVEETIILSFLLFLRALEGVDRMNSLDFYLLLRFSSEYKGEEKS